MDKTYKYLLTLAFILIICTEGILQSVIEAADGERPFIIELFLQNPNRTNLRVFENELEDRSYLSKITQPFMRSLQYTALKDTGDKALMGRDGWFFYKPGVRYLIEPWPIQSGKVSKHDNIISAITDFRDQLDSRGIKLMLLPTPGKASVYPEMLTSRAAKEHNPVYANTRKILNDIQAAGIELIDLFELYQQESVRHEPLYLKQDTHWSTHGMQLAAKHTSERLMELGWVNRNTKDYKLKPVSFSRYGDVLSMINLPTFERQYEPEQLNCQQVIDSSDGLPYKDDPSSEILVIGDSFLRIYERDEPGSAGFVSHLAYEMKIPVTSIINDGGASTLVRQELSRKSDLLQNKKVVIWEFVERDLLFGIEGWKKVHLR
jgi:acetyltransferase AlgX (SGNH hydrolase-like protein)